MAENHCPGNAPFCNARVKFLNIDKCKRLSVIAITVDLNSIDIQEMMSTAMKCGGSKDLNSILSAFDLNANKKNKKMMLRWMALNMNDVMLALKRKENQKYPLHEESERSVKQEVRETLLKEPSLELVVTEQRMIDDSESICKSLIVHEALQEGLPNYKDEVKNNKVREVEQQVAVESDSSGSLENDINIHNTAERLKKHSDTAIIVTNNSVMVSFKKINENSYEEDTRMESTSHDRKYVNCTTLIGEFDIGFSTWSSMIDSSGKFISRVYPTMISEQFFIISQGCVLQLKSANYYKKNTIRIATIYGYCGHSNITTFKFLCLRKKDSCDIHVKVYTNATSCTHPEKKTRELSGVHRDKIKDKLVKKSPKLVRLECVRNADVQGVHLKNLQDVKSYSVFRKAKSEALAADDLHEDPLIDLFMMRNEQSDKNTRYVQYVYHPLQVIMFRKDILDLLKIVEQQSKKEHKELVMHIDATGSVVRKIKQCEDKRVLYYAVVFRYNNYVLPATEFISCKHSAPDIGVWLLMYKKFLTDEGQWPLCKRIVSDFSWALLYSILIQWNNMTLPVYLNACHNMILGTKCETEPDVTVHLCVCHVIKMLIGDVKSVAIEMKQTDRKPFKELVMHVMCTIMTSSSYDKIKMILKHAFTVLLTEYKTEKVQRSLSMLCTVCKETDIIDVLQEYEPEDDFEAHEFIGKKAMYQQSPFYKDISVLTKVLLKVETKEKDSDTFSDANTNDSDEQESEQEKRSNTYYSKRMATTMLNKYVPYLPMWTGLLFKRHCTTIAVQRLSNAPVENWFGQVKNIILEGKTNLRPNRFIRKVSSFITDTHKEISLQIPKEGCARGKRKRKMSNVYTLKKVNTVLETKDAKKQHIQHSKIASDSKSRYDDDVDSVDIVEETWQKPEKRQKTYFESKYLQKIAEPRFKMPSEAVDIIKRKVLPNHLIDDPDYYVCIGPAFDYIICTVRNPLGGPFHISSCDIDVLRGKKWFTTDIITSISYMLLKKDVSKSSVIYHDNIATMALLGKEEVSTDSWLLQTTVITPTTRKLFFPLNINNMHWVLVYANLDIRQFAYIDPQSENPRESTLQSVFNKFLLFLSLVTKSDIATFKNTWTITRLKHPLQHDGYNCGVFVMYFIEQLMFYDTIDDKFSPDNHRMYLFRELLIQSDSMLNVCLACKREHNVFLPSAKKYETVECTSCLRWFHINKTECLPADVPRDINVLSKPDVKVHCRLCRI